MTESLERTQQALEETAHNLKTTQEDLKQAIEQNVAIKEEMTATIEDMKQNMEARQQYMETRFNQQLEENKEQLRQMQQFIMQQLQPRDSTDENSVESPQRQRKRSGKKNLLNQPVLGTQKNFQQSPLQQMSSLAYPQNQQVHGYQAPALQWTTGFPTIQHPGQQFSTNQQYPGMPPPNHYLLPLVGQPTNHTSREFNQGPFQENGPANQ
jgi:hypothetical protein